MPLVQLERMTPGQFHQEIAIYLATFAREQAQWLATKPTKDEPEETRSRRRKEQARVKKSDDWLDRIICDLYFRMLKERESL